MAAAAAIVAQLNPLQLHPWLQLRHRMRLPQRRWQHLLRPRHPVQATTSSSSIPSTSHIMGITSTTATMQSSWW